MKIDWVLGCLPVFIREKSDLTYRGLTRLNYIVVKKMEDEVCIEHEKIHARDAYLFVIFPILFVNLVWFMGYSYISIPLMLLHLAFLGLLFTSRGVYEYELRAFRKNIEIESEYYTKNVEEVYLKNAKILQKHYGKYAESLSLYKIVEDLKK